MKSSRNSHEAVVDARGKARLTLSVNGEPRQSASTRQLPAHAFSVFQT